MTELTIRSELPRARPRLRMRRRRYAVLPWLAMLSSPEVRGRLTIIVALCLALIGAVFIWLMPARGPDASNITATWASRSAARLGATDLPGSPEAESASTVSPPAPVTGLEAAEHNAAAPFTKLGPPARPFILFGSPEDHGRARACLAAAMLYEAGGDAAGQFAVGQVVLNRVRHPAFPPSICGVVTQGSERPIGCQFTFTCDGALVRRQSAAAIATALARADAMLDGFVFQRVGLATHYHTEQVYPWWSSKLEKIARVGPHLFFRWSGFWGSARAGEGKRSTPEPSAALFAAFAGSSPSGLSDEPQAAVKRAGTAASLLAASGIERLSGSKVATSPLASAAIPEARRLPLPQALSSAEATLVSPPALAGNRLLRMIPETGTFYILLGASADIAQVRHTAQALCGGRTPCRVFGWRDLRDVPQGNELSGAEQATSAFRFVKVAPRKAPAAASVTSMF